MDTLFQTDYEIHKAVASGQGNTIYEADNLLSEGITDYECVKNLFGDGETKFECTKNYAKQLGLQGDWATRFEVDLALYDAMHNEPIEYYKLNPDISTDEEFNNLPWGRKINTIELDGAWENTTWYTITFPFTCKRSDFVLGQDKLSICKVLKIKGVTDTEAYYDSALVGMDDTIEANYPYQMYNISGSRITQLLAENVRFTNNHIKESVVPVYTDGEWEFIGCYFKKMYGVGSTQEYMVNDGQKLLWVDENGVEVKAYSGIFRTKT